MASDNDHPAGALSVFHSDYEQFTWLDQLDTAACLMEPE
jgi:hypothetical protein